MIQFTFLFLSVACSWFSFGCDTFPDSEYLFDKQNLDLVNFMNSCESIKTYTFFSYNTTTNAFSCLQIPLELEPKPSMKLSVLDIMNTTNSFDDSEIEPSYYNMTELENGN